MVAAHIVIIDAAQYEAAFDRVLAHFTGKSPLADAEYSALSDAMLEYASAHPTPTVELDAADMLEFEVDQSGLTPRAFAAKHQLSFDVPAFLRREKRMTIGIARELLDRFNWPADVILRPYKVNAPRKAAAKQGTKPKATAKRRAATTA